MKNNFRLHLVYVLALLSFFKGSFASKDEPKFASSVTWDKQT